MNSKQQQKVKKNSNQTQETHAKFKLTFTEVIEADTGRFPSSMCMYIKHHALL